MATLESFFEEIVDDKKREKLKGILDWILKTFPTVKMEYKWNQPMITDHGTYICGFSYATGHITVGLENYVMNKFVSAIEEAGYSHGKMIFRIKWDEEVNFDLLKSIILFVIEDKSDVKSFWR